MVSPIPPKPPAPPKPTGKRPPGGNIVRDTRGPNYPKNPARPGETKAQYLDRVRGEKGGSSGGKGGSSSGGGRRDMAPIDSGRFKIPAPPGRGAGTGGGSSSGGKGGSSSGGGRRDMGPVRGAPKGPAPMPGAPSGGGRVRDMGPGSGLAPKPGGGRVRDTGPGSMPPKPRPPAPSKFGTPRPTGGSRPKPLKGKM
jgi:hypothetical protein